MTLRAKNRSAAVKVRKRSASTAADQLVTIGRRRRHPPKSQRKGRGLVNTLIDLLPIEAHLPGGYRYCGPGTKLQERLKRGDPGINGLDDACKQHDIVYSKTSDTGERNKADLLLADRAWERVKASDSSLGERAAAYAVTNAMKLKAKLGAGCRRSKPKHPRGGGKEGAGVRSKRKAPRKQNRGGGRKKRKQQETIERIIPLPTNAAVGGSLRSVLTKAGVPPASMPVAARKIMAAVLKRKRKGSKIGRGLYLRPYRTGYGLYLRPWNGRLN